MDQELKTEMVPEPFGDPMGGPGPDGNEPVVYVRRCTRCGAPDPTNDHQCQAPKEKRPALEAWHRPLDNGRAEILCRAPGYHLRVSAPEEQAWEAVEMFERWTGLEIQSERRPRQVHSPPAGQISMLDMLDGGDTTAEIKSEGNHG